MHAAFGRDPTKLSAFTEKFAIKKSYGTLESLLDDEEIDVIYVGLPSHLHHDAVVAAAKRGKPVLSPKSLCTTTEDAVSMSKVCRDSKIFFLEGLIYLCHPLMEKVAEIVRSGDLG